MLVETIENANNQAVHNQKGSIMKRQSGNDRKLCSAPHCVSTEQGFRMMDQFPEEAQRALLARLLRSRRRFFSTSINGRTIWWRRADMRDYLRGKYPDVRQAHAQNDKLTGQQKLEKGKA